MRPQQLVDRCATCHGNDGSGQTQVAASLPQAPDLRLPQRRSYPTARSLHHQNGVRLTACLPEAIRTKNRTTKLETRSVHPRLRQLSAGEKCAASNVRVPRTTQARWPAKMPQQIYQRWKKTPIGNVSAIPGASRGHHPRSRQNPSPVHEGPGSTRLRQSLEAAVTSQKSAMIFSGAGRSGCHPPRLASHFVPKERIGGNVSILQTICNVPPAPPAMAAIRRLRLHTEGPGVERRLRALPRTRQRPC